MFCRVFLFIIVIFVKKNQSYVRTYLQLKKKHNIVEMGSNSSGLSFL